MKPSNDALLTFLKNHPIVEIVELHNPITYSADLVYNRSGESSGGHAQKATAGPFLSPLNLADAVIGLARRKGYAIGLVHSVTVTGGDDESDRKATEVYIEGRLVRCLRPGLDMAPGFMMQQRVAQPAVDPTNLLALRDWYAGLTDGGI
jgi:hypothetical protein